MPELLRQRPLVAQVLMPTLVPAAFGAICGWLLGVSEVAYTILTVLAIAGCNLNSVLTGHKGESGAYGDFNAFQTFRLLDVLLVLACIAPFILAYIIVRSHELTWRPGEVTMIVGMLAATLILLNGVILGKPGSDPVDISLEYGWFVGLFGAAMIAVGGTLRQALTSPARKPPGVL